MPADLGPGEAQLLLGWGQFIQTRYANPDRVGCPCDEVLQRMASDAKNFHDRQVIDHAARCAPCSNTLQKLIYAARQQRKPARKPR